MNKKRKQLTALVGTIIILRILFIFLMGPMPQDAYYFFYSQHPALSYFDHPPMIAYILRLFTLMLGNNIIAIKFADSLVTLLTLIVFYKLAQCFLGIRQLKKAVLLLISTLMVAILSLVTTPDAPLLLFWALSLYLLYHAIFLNRPVYWLWAGLSMGLAFDSKYTAIFLPAGLLLFLLVAAPYRRYFASKWFWLSVIIFLIVVSPVVIWNAENHFASFKFQSTSRMSPSTGIHLQLKYFFGLIGHQLLVVGPVLLLLLIGFTYRIFKKYKFSIFQMAPERLFLLCFFLPLVISFTLLSFLFWVKLNWLMPAYLSAIIWASVYIRDKWVNYQLIFSFAVHVLMAVEIIFYPFPVRSDDTWFGWKELATQVQHLKKQHPEAFVFSADGYKTAAELNLLTPGFTYSQNIIGQHALEFDYVNADLRKLKGRNAIFIDSEPRFKDENKSGQPNQELNTYFRSVEELPPILIKINGQTVRKFLVYYCSGYLTASPRLVPGTNIQ